MHRLRPLFVVALAALALGCPLAPADDKEVQSTGSCQGPATLAIPSSNAGRVGENDCRDAAGRSGDIYTFTLATARNFELALGGSGFTPRLTVVRGTPTAEGREVMAEGGPDVDVTRLHMAAGSYYAVVGGNDGRGGAFTLEARDVGAGCKNAFGVVGAAYSGQVTTGDCGAAPGFQQDIVEYYLQAGERLTGTVSTDKEVDVLIMTGAGSSAPLVSRTVALNRPGSVTFTATSAGRYRLHVIANPSRFGVVAYSVQTN